MYLLQWLTVASAVPRDTSIPVQSHNELLLVQFCDNGLRLSTARRHRGEWQPQTSCFVSVDFDNAENDSAHVADLIQQALILHKIDVSDVLILVNRRKLLLKLCNIKSVSQDQLAAAVQLQAESRGYRQDEYLVDFLPEKLTESDDYRIVMAVYPRQHFNWMQSIALQLNWNVIGVTAAELDVIKLARFHAEKGAGICILAQRDHLDFIVGYPQQALMLYSVAQPEDPKRLPAVLVGTFRRIQSALPATMNASGSSQIALFGEHAAALASILQNQLQIKASVHSNPWPESPESWASLLANEGATQVVNFTKPRQSPNYQSLKRAQQKQWLIRGSLVVVLGLLSQQWWLKHLEGQMSSLNAKRQTLNRTADRQEEIIDAESRLLQWMNAKVELPTEVAKLLRALPGNDRVYLNELRVDCSENQPAQFTLRGFARAPDDALQVSRSLMEQTKDFDLQPENIERNEQDPHYQTAFEVMANLRSGTAEEAE